MASVYRKTVTKALPGKAEVFIRNGERFARWRDAKGKQRTAPITVPAKGIHAGELRIVIEARTFTAKYRDAAGVIHEVATGCRDEMAARSVLGELVRRVEMVRGKILTAAQDGIIDHQSTGLLAHVEEFISHQTAKGLNVDRIKSTRQRIRQISADCEFGVLSELNGPALVEWMLTRQQTGMSAGSRNGYRDAMVGFGNWCVRTGRLISNPFAGVPKADTKIDCRRKRRALNEDELIRLLKVARQRPLKDALTIRRGKRRGETAAKVRDEVRARLDELGRERALIYKTLVLTGLRLNELRSLTVGQLELAGRMPFIALDAADEKNRQGSTIPLRSDLANDLGLWLDLMPAMDRIPKQFRFPTMR